MTRQPTQYETLPGGSIDYAHYEARMRKMRSVRLRSAIRACRNVLKKYRNRFDGLLKSAAGASHARSGGMIVPAE